MADNKQIRLGVDSSEFENNLQRMKANAEEMAREMISNSRKLSTSSKEVLSDIEDQIKALERRNKLQFEMAEKELSFGRQTGEISESEFKRRSGELGFEKGEGKEETQLLRDVISAIRETSREEIRENRQGIEREISTSKTVSELAPEGDELALLRETLQKGEISRLTREEREEDGFAGVKRGVSSVGGRVVSASSPHELVAELGLDAAKTGASVGGIAGGLAATAAVVMMGVIRSIKASMPYEQAMSTMYGATGLTGEGFGRGMSAYGYTMDETISERAAISRARGERSGSGRAAQESLMMQRGWGIDQGAIHGLERTLRGDTDTTARGATEEMMRAMKFSGVMTGNDRSLVPEYLQILTQINQQQLSTLGEVNSGVNTRMIAAIGDLDDTFKNPATLQTLYQGMEAGLGASSDPNIRALQFSALGGQINPDTGKPYSMWEMDKVLEDPMKSPHYVASMLDMLSQMDERQSGHYMASGVFGGMRKEMVEKMMEGYAEDSTGFMETFDPDSFVGVGVSSLEGDAAAATGTLMESQATLTNSFMATGLAVTDSLKNFTDSLTKAFDELKGGIKENSENIVKANEDLQESVDALKAEGKNVAAALVATRRPGGWGAGR